MDTILIAFIVFIVVAVIVAYLYQKKINRKTKNGIKLMLTWYDYIIAHPDNFDIVKIREIGDKVDNYIKETDIGKKVIYITPKLREYVVSRFEKKETESIDDAFERLTDWGGDTIRLEVFWTMLRGSFAEYSSQKDAGENPDFSMISAPIAMIRRYFRL